MGVYELSGAGSVKTGRTLYTSMNAGNQFGAMVPIASATATGSSGTFSFENIPATYQDLCVVVQIRTDQSTVTSRSNELRVLLNNSFTGYSNTRLIGDGTSAQSARDTSQSSIWGGYIPISTDTAGIFAVQSFHILNYANTSTYKTVLYRAALDKNGSSTNGTGTTMLGAGLWQNTSAVSIFRVDTFGFGNYTAGSTATLYGIRAANS